MVSGTDRAHTEPELCRYLFALAMYFAGYRGNYLYVHVFLPDYSMLPCPSLPVDSESDDGLCVPESEENIACVGSEVCIVCNSVCICMC